MLGDRDDAADATHEVFIRALPHLADIEHPAAWLQTVARRLCVDIARRRASERRALERATEADAEEADPQEVAVRRDTIVAAMACLPRGERRVLLHTIVLDAPLREVAARLAISYTAAAQSLSRARRRVRTLNLPAGLVTSTAHAAVRRLVPPTGTADLRMAASRCGALTACAALLVCSSHDGPAQPLSAPPGHGELQGAPDASSPSVGPAPSEVSHRGTLGRTLSRSLRAVAAPLSKGTPPLRVDGSSCYPQAGANVWPTPAQPTTYDATLICHGVSSNMTLTIALYDNGALIAQQPPTTCSQCTFAITPTYSARLQSGHQYTFVARTWAALAPDAVWSSVTSGCVGVGASVMVCTAKYVAATTAQGLVTMETAGILP